jgi:hypothetical protein
MDLVTFRHIWRSECLTCALNIDVLHLYRGDLGVNSASSVLDLRPSLSLVVKNTAQILLGILINEPFVPFDSPDPIWSGPIIVSAILDQLIGDTHSLLCPVHFLILLYFVFSLLFKVAANAVDSLVIVASAYLVKHL